MIRVRSDRGFEIIGLRVRVGLQRHPDAAVAVDEAGGRGVG